MKEPTERVIIKTHPDSGCVLIYDERMRQIHSELWTEKHDDKHVKGELAMAGVCYGSLAEDQISRGYTASTSKIPPPDLWPWDAGWWKPSDDPIRNLVKAGALIAAEIDRLKRLERKESK